MVMADEDLTDLRGAIPQWIFEVASGCALERVIFDESGVWNRPDGVTNINLFLVGPGGEGRGNFGTATAAAGAPGGGGEVFYETNVDVSSQTQWRLLVDRADLATPGGDPHARTQFGHGDPSNSTFVELSFVRDGRTITCGANQGGSGYPSLDPNNSGASGGGGSRSVFISTTNPPESNRYVSHSDILPPGGGDPGGAGGESQLVTFINPKIGDGETDFAGVAGGGGGAGGAGAPATSGGAGAGGPGLYYGNIVGDDLGDNGWFGGGGGGAAGASLWDEDSGPQIAQGAPGGLGGGGNGYGYNFAQVAPYGGTPGLAGSGGGGGGAGAAFETFFVPGGAGIGVILYCPSGANNLSLKDIVTQICERAGMPSTLIDVSLLPDVNIEGLAVTNQYTAGEILRSLGQAYLFDPSPRDGKVWFIPRGGNHVATVADADLVDEDDTPEDDRRDDSISVPRVLHLNYWDVDGGLATSKQSSERSGDRRSVGETSIQTPVLMTATQAAQNVVINHKVLAENQRGAVNLTLPDKWIGLRLAHPIIAEIGGVNHRVMIQKMSVLDGYQKYEATYDRQSAYTSNVEGIPAVPQTPPPTSNVGPTLIIPLDIQLLKDSDDNEGLIYYVAVAGISPAWSGALVELSYDGGANYVDSREALASSIIGNLVDDLPSHPREYPDTVHSFRVSINPPDSELEDVGLSGMQNRLNLAAVGSLALGWELINFGACEETTADQWELSNLLRGRKDTTPRLHNAGESFVMLDHNVLGLVVSSVTDIGRTLTLRATSLGAPVETGTVVSMTYAGQSQIERHIGYLDVRIDGSNAIVSWQGVARLGGGSLVAHGAQFIGYRVTFYDNVNDPIVVDTLSQSITQDISSLEDDFIIKVVQRNNLTGEGPPTFWPDGADVVIPPTEDTVPPYLFEIGQDMEFDMGGIMVQRMIFNDAVPPYRIDIRRIVTAGLDYSTHYFPLDADSIDDRTFVYALADQVWGLTRHPTDPERLYWSDGNTAYYANVREHMGGGSPVITSLSPLLAGLMFNEDGTELYAAKIDLPSSCEIRVLDPDTMNPIRDLSIGSSCPFKFIQGTDASAPNSLWLCDIINGTHNGQLFRVDRTTGVIDKTIECRRYPMGGLIVGDFIYVYCKNSDVGHDPPAGFGMFKYQISTESEVANFINADDGDPYIGQESNAVVVDAPYISVGWGIGHKVFDTTVDAYLDAP
jgi:hypothetical protein